AFTPDERYFVATAEGKVQFWEVNGWRSVDGLPEYANGIAFSPDGRMLACGSGRETVVWELATRKLRVKEGDKEYWHWSQRFSPAGRLLALLTSADTVEVWDVFAASSWPRSKVTSAPSGLSPSRTTAGICSQLATIARCWRGTWPAPWRPPALDRK